VPDAADSIARALALALTNVLAGRASEPPFD
jgi:hypothetical protein